MWGFGPLVTKLGRDMGFTPFVMGACIVIFVVSLLIDTKGVRIGGLTSFLSPSDESLALLGWSGPFPVLYYGRWWSVLTAGWLHASLIHIGFNMMALRNVADPVAEFYVANRMVIIYTVAGVAGFIVSTLGGAYLRFIPFIGGADFTVGASAAICGLIGSLFYYGRRAGSRGVSDQAKQWAIMILIFGFLVPGIDNWAHLGGFAGGYLCSKVLDPLKPERMDHFLGAVACLVITAAAFVYSILDGWETFYRSVGR